MGTIDTPKIRRLHAEIMALRARYDDHFPPAIYAVLKKMQQEHAQLVHQASNHGAARG